MARAAIHVMNLEKKICKAQTSLMCSHINVGSGSDLTIKELVETIKEVVGFKKKIKLDSSKPDGASKKFLDSESINNLGFKSEKSLKKWSY